MKIAVLFVALCVAYAAAVPVVQIESPYMGGLKNTAVETTEGGKSDIKCALCQLAMAKIDKVVESKDTEDAIVKKVEGVCKLVGKQLGPLCKDMLDNYGEKFLDSLLKKYLDPKDVCNDVKLCSA